MIFHVMTLFPEMVKEGLAHSIVGKAIINQQIQLNTINFRDYTHSKHLKVDDYPYGGGAGMLLQAQPIMDAYRAVFREYSKKPRVIYLTPQGKVFNQQMAFELAEEEELIFLCGHYEGVDERVVQSIVTDEVSIGDYVLTGGELAVMVMIDAIARLVPGVLNNEVSSETESFYEGLLEYPQYTRPAIYEEQEVPEVLLSGNHQAIAQWRREQSLMRTFKKRPDLLETAELTEADLKYLKKHCNYKRNML